jgi:hypothetical protein
MKHSLAFVILLAMVPAAPPAAAQNSDTGSFDEIVVGYAFWDMSLRIDDVGAHEALITSRARFRISRRPISMRPFV